MIKTEISEKNEINDIQCNNIDVLRKICNVLYGVSEFEMDAKDSINFLLFALDPKFNNYINVNCYDATAFPWHFEAINVICVGFAPVKFKPKYLKNENERIFWFF
jgi:hypothetical protein